MIAGPCVAGARDEALAEPRHTRQRSTEFGVALIPALPHREGPQRRRRSTRGVLARNKKPRLYATSSVGTRFVRIPVVPPLLPRSHLRETGSHSLRSGMTCGLTQRTCVSLGRRVLPPAARERVRAACSLPSLHSVSGRCRSRSAYYSQSARVRYSVVCAIGRVVPRGERPRQGIGYEPPRHPPRQPNMPLITGACWSLPVSVPRPSARSIVCSSA